MKHKTEWFCVVFSIVMSFVMCHLTKDDYKPRTGDRVVVLGVLKGVVVQPHHSSNSHKVSLDVGGFGMYTHQQLEAIDIESEIE